MTIWISLKQSSKSVFLSTVLHPGCVAVGRSGPSPTENKTLRCGDCSTDGHLLVKGHVGTLTDKRIHKTMWPLLMDTLLTYTVTVQPRSFTGTSPSRIQKRTPRWLIKHVTFTPAVVKSTCNTRGQRVVCSRSQLPLTRNRIRVFDAYVCVDLFFWFRLILCCFVFFSLCGVETCTISEYKLLENKTKPCTYLDCLINVTVTSFIKRTSKCISGGCTAKC